MPSDPEPSEPTNPYPSTGAPWEVERHDAWNEGYAAGSERPPTDTEADDETPPWVEGDIPPIDSYLPCEVFVAGALSTQPPFRTFHPQWCLPLAKVAIHAFCEYEPDDAHRSVASGSGDGT